MIEMNIQWEDIALAAHGLGIEPCAMEAVYKVESSGNGFLPSGRPKILFEGHIFWRELNKLKKERPELDPEVLAAQHPGILYPKWRKDRYLGGEAEHKRLEEAMGIHHDAALKSASWGAFQIMGFNHALCGYETVRDFVDAQSRGAAAQLEAFCGFVKMNNLVGHLKNMNWAAFAKGYNGPAYAENQYDTRLAKAYSKCRGEHGQG